MSTPVPERISKYEISAVLGQGAMGVVYKGFDPHIRRPVAIKTIHKNLLGDPEANAQQDSIAARFRNEAQAVGRIAHPGVVAIYEFGEDEHCAYIAMEFVEGRNLEQLLLDSPLLDQPWLLHLMDQLLDALGAAHAQGICHRDIKPANLLLTTGGQLKLTDFGIARIADLNLTQVASTIGTPGYMAPEQYIGDELDHRADLFACGALLYRLLSGRPAFSGTPERVMYQVLNEHPTPPSQVDGVTRTPALDDVVARALAKHPDDRYPNAQAMRQALAVAGAAGGAGGAGDATVILPLAMRPAVSAVATGAPGTLLTPPTGWDPQVLSRIERALASHVGPMAKLMVRDAARHCADFGSLATAVSQHIAEEGQRARFLDQVEARPAGTHASAARASHPASAVSAAQPQAAQTGTPVPTASPPLTDDFRARALQALSRQLGPIAKVVVKRAAERAGGDQARFVQALVDGVDGVDRAALERELGL
ncbi:MAG: serine/threonine-protein kinase [Hydrogenophaga sp.]|nr:serine/threonine-protein kinase [Hydrogenophaga sp.]